MLTVNPSLLFGSEMMHPLKRNNVYLLSGTSCMSLSDTSRETLALTSACVTFVA